MDQSQAELRKKARALFGRRYKVCPSGEGHLVASGDTVFPILCAWCGLPVELHAADKAALREEVIAGCFDALKKFADETEATFRNGNGQIGHLITAKALRYFLEKIEKDLALEVPEAEQAMLQKFVRVFGNRHLNALKIMNTGPFDGVIAEGG